MIAECRCFKDSEGWYTGACDIHRSLSPELIKLHTWGGREDCDVCYYCGHARDSKVHKKQLCLFCDGAGSRIPGQSYVTCSKHLEVNKVDGQPRLDGKKFDDGKPQLGLVPKSLIWAVGIILTFGANKYGEHNWRKGLKWSRAYNALLRHLTAWWDGESLDLESGKSHLWHAATELAFLVEYEETKTGEDDRWIRN